MTNPQNGRSGSQNPSREVSPEKLTHTNDHSLSNNASALFITGLNRITESQPTVWEGRTSEGHAVHIAYRFGEVSIEVLRPHATMHGCVVLNTVARFRPALIDAELTDGRDGQPRDLYARRLMAEHTIIGEIRRSNHADMRRSAAGRMENDLETLLNRDRLVIRDAQLMRWLDMRNAHLPRLVQRGLVAGVAPVSIQVL